MKYLILSVLIIITTSCSVPFTLSHTDEKELDFIAHYQNYAYNFDEWRRYVNPVTGYTFSYPREYFSLDNLLSLINLNEIEKEDLKSHFLVEEKKIHEAKTAHYTTFYSNSEIQINSYRKIGEFKGKYEIIISDRGITHSFTFYVNNRRITLTASKTHNTMSNYDMYTYYENLKLGHLDPEDDSYFNKFNAVLSSLSHYSGTVPQ